MFTCFQTSSPCYLLSPRPQKKLIVRETTLVTLNRILPLSLLLKRHVLQKQTYLFTSWDEEKKLEVHSLISISLSCFLLEITAANG